MKGWKGFAKRTLALWVAAAMAACCLPATVVAEAADALDAAAPIDVVEDTSDGMSGGNGSEVDELADVEEGSGVADTGVTGTGSDSAADVPGIDDADDNGAIDVAAEGIEEVEGVDDLDAATGGMGAESTQPSVAYQTHVQKDGWQDWRRDGEMAGTSHRSLRLEGINIKLEGQQFPGSIEYRTHVQKVGWQGYVRDGAMSGTSGKSLRLEAIQIRLTGEMAKRYDVWYHVHAQTYGWMGWAKNDSPAGTAGYSKRLEAIEVRVLPKGSAAPGSQSGEFITKKGDSPAQSYAGHQVTYCSHVQSFGWRPYVCDGQMSGTTGLSKRLEGIKIKLLNQECSGSIEYRTHVQKIGWQGYVRDGAMAGTSGKSLRLEAIQIRLTGQMAERFDVWYRVHAQTFGWMGWAKNDQQAGTAGYAKRLECLEVLVLPKGSPAPGSTAGAFRQPSVNNAAHSRYATIAQGLARSSATKYAYYRYIDVYGDSTDEMLVTWQPNRGSTGWGFRIYTFENGKERMMLDEQIRGDVGYHDYRFYKSTSSFTRWSRGYGNESYGHYTAGSGSYVKATWCGRISKLGGSAYNGAWEYSPSQSAYNSTVSSLQQGSSLTIVAGENGWLLTRA